MVFNEIYTSSRYLTINFYGLKESVEMLVYPYVMASNYAVFCLRFNCLIELALSCLLFNWDGSVLNLTV